MSVSSAFKNDEDSSVVKRDTAAEIKKGDPVLLQEWEKGLITHSNLYSDIEFPEVLQERGREPNDARKEGLFKLLLLWGPKGRFFSVLITRLLYSPEEVAKEKDEPLHPFFTDPDIRSPHTLTRYRALNKMYYGKQRDMVNYPTPTTRDGPPPTRGWLFPKSWIDSLEDKVGVMGTLSFSSFLCTHHSGHIIRHTSWPNCPTHLYNNLNLHRHVNAWTRNHLHA